MPPPPAKLLKTLSERDALIEQLLIDCAYFETLEVFRTERSKRAFVPAAESQNGEKATTLIEKKGDVWVCVYCDKSFTTKGSAKRHLQSTHSSDSKQFECPRCTSKFARRDDLYTHLRRMHAANNLVEAMIEEHKAELKGEHKGSGLGRLMSVVSHNEHLDVVLPSGNTICQPFSTEVSSAMAREPSKAAKACRAAKCTHWRVMHDGHEDVLVNGALHHKNQDGEWEFHGELGNVEDFEFLLATQQQQCVEGSSGSSCSGSDGQFDVPSPSHELHAQHDEGNQDFAFDDLEFFLNETMHSMPGNTVANKQQQATVENLVLPGGSVFCRKLNPLTPRSSSQMSWPSDPTHKHGPGCGHQRMRHGNHYDYIVGNVVESDCTECPLNGSTMLEHDDSATLAYVVSVLGAEQQQQQVRSSSSSSSLASS